MAAFYGGGTERSIGFTELWKVSFSLHIVIIIMSLAKIW